MNPERPHPDRDQLLKRWLVGDIDRKDERTIESLSQDDPFLADAMEGFQAMPEGEHTEAVTKLKANLRHRTEARDRSTGFYLLRIAAVGSMLVAAWLVFQQFDGGEAKSERLVQHESTSPAAAEEQNLEPAMAQEERTAFDYSQADDNEKEALLNSTEEVKSAPKKREEKVAAENRSLDNVAAKDLKEEARAKVNKEGRNLQNDDDIAAKTTAADADFAEEKIEAMPASAPVMAYDEAAADSQFEDVTHRESSAPMIHKIVGQVTNDFGDPLTGASVYEEETQTGTVTDANGYFSIETEAIQPNLRISYLGYEEREMAIQDKDFIKVELAERDALLEEVTVASKKRSAPSDNSPKPEGGFKKLEKYLKKNLNQPANAEGISGEVQLRFRIQADGSLSDFEVLKSLGKDFDEEAERLLREGPKWEAAPEAVVVYSIKF